MTDSFVHLHLHSEYSLSDGLLRLKPLVNAIAEAGMPAVALTDLNNLFGLVKFYRAAIAVGVKPIVGMEASLAMDDGDGEPGRVVLLAQDQRGFVNLSRLSSRGYSEGYRLGQPILQRSWLADAADGLIVLSGGREGEIGRLLLAGRMEAARSRLSWWRATFPDRFYLELIRTGRRNEESYLDAAVTLAGEMDLPVVASNDARFLRATDFEAHEARVCIQQGFTLEDPNRPRHYSEQQYLRSAEEMAALFQDLPEAIANSVEIARRCNLQLTLGQYSLPAFPVPQGMTLGELLVQEAERGLEDRLQRLAPPAAGETAVVAEVYRERLHRELGVIIQMGFPGYFLIVADFIRWAKQHGIPVGPGRGSGAGSLVAYSLQITDLDPIAYDLLFERFLNPERVSLPDFDVDFCMEGRDRVIDYVAERYGRDKVSQIATHGTMAAKAVVRDVGRVLGHPYGFVDRIAKLIPFEIGMTLDKALEQEEELSSAYETEDDVRAIVDLGRALEGLARNVGRHAGGVVIAATELTDFTPLYFEEGSTSPVTQLDKDDVEAVGLVKFDFLGLRTLTIIDWAVHSINAKRAARGEPAIAIEALPLVDSHTFELLKAQQTTGVFQLESRGMKELIKRLQPDRFGDIIALVALFRPGPLQSGMVEDFIDRKHGRAKVTYPHADLEPILEPTYGVILYQEQVMQIAQVLAGYTLGGADLLRRAMGKKKPEEMAKQRVIFVSGATGRGVQESVAQHIFDLMEKFAGYGFNKSHSAAYALVSYQTAWLKRHYPADFMAAVLSADMDNTDKVVVFIDECRAMGLRVIAPDINRSGFLFSADHENQVVYGLGAVKGVGEAAVQSVIEERERGGAYQDLFQLCQRLDLKRVNRRALEALIKAGALDSLGASRPAHMARLGMALQLAEQHLRADSCGQEDLFGLGLDDSPPPPSGATETEATWDEARRLAEEKQALGLYLTGHPISCHLAELRHYTNGRIAQALAQAEAEIQGGRRADRERRTVLAGLVVELRTRVSTRGGRMAFLTLDDRSARVEVAVYTEAYSQYRDVLAMDTVLVVEGSLAADEFSGSVRLRAERVLDLDRAREAFSRRLRLQLNQGDFAGDLADHLARTLEPFRQGRCPVVIDYTGCGARAELQLDVQWWVHPTEELLGNLRGLVGNERVAVEFQ
jgi:DNA polymerase-3 subunit alpha